MTLLSFFLGKAPSGGGMDWTTLVMMGGVFVVFYFFFIRPQQKKQKEEKEFRDNLQKGDKIITLGGIYGKITSVDDNYILIEVDEGVKLKMDKSSVRPAPDFSKTSGK